MDIAKLRSKIKNTLRPKLCKFSQQTWIYFYSEVNDDKIET